jgi:dTDP-4-dehydrorhamnose reductase
VVLIGISVISRWRLGGLECSYDRPVDVSHNRAAGRLLITGTSGYLGSALAASARDQGWQVTGTRLTAGGDGVVLDVRDRNAVEELVAHVRPDVVVHTAYRQAGPEMWAVNESGSRSVASAAAGAGARLLHLSTDFVFDGELARPYREDDPPRPVTEYGRSKLAAERAVAELHPAALVVRTSLIYGGAVAGPHERLVLDALAGRVEVGFFEDELRSPVAAPDLAAALLELAVADAVGILHVAGPEPVSRLEFARLIAAAHGGDPARLRSARSAEQPTRRPRDCTLDSSRAHGLLRTRVRGVHETLATTARPAAI